MRRPAPSSAVSASRRRVRFALLGVLAGLALSAAGPAGAEGLPDADVRFENVRVAPTAEQLSLLEELGNVEVGWTELGTPHSLRARSGALTEPSAAAPDEIARSFVRERAPLFRQDPAYVAGL